MLKEIYGSVTMLKCNLFSAPGRTEISGNHTDHQHGCVLAAAVNLETVAEVIALDDPVIIIHSEGYAPAEINLNDLDVHPEEMNTTNALGSFLKIANPGCISNHIFVSLEGLK